MAGERRVTRYFASSPLMNDEKLVEFSSEGIKTSGDLSSTFLKWAAITRAVESEMDLIVHTGNEKFGWFIPKTAFETNDDLIMARNILRKELNEKVRLL